MRLTVENKEKVRQRILTGAARLLREKGYANVNLDRVMQTAGLTRGAFYAHFRSKADLFAEVARREHPLARMLAARKGGTAGALWEQMLAIFDGYLDPANLERVFAGCTFASLSGDVSRSPAPVRQAYQQAWQEIRTEMLRGQQGRDPGTVAAALVLATGAVATAFACQDAAARREVLSAARHGFHALMRQAGADATGSSTQGDG